MVELPCEEVVDRETEGVRGENDVAVGEQKNLPIGQPCPRLHRVALPQPTLGQLRDVEGAHPRLSCRHAIHDGTGSVRGPVVHGDHLESRIVELRQRPQGLFDPHRFVPRGNHHGDLRPHRWIRRRPGAVREPASMEKRIVRTVEATQTMATIHPAARRSHQAISPPG